MECFPPCAACTGLCKREPVQAAPPARGARHPAPNRNLARLKCGCAEIPFPLLHVLGEHIDKVLCDLHGWQPLAPEKKPPRKKRKSEIPGQGEMVPY